MIEYTYAPDNFSHAAAACAFNGGILTAMYSGSAECHSSQRVCLYLTGHGEMKGPISLEPLTGNPILFTNNSVANIIYSKFEEFPIYRAHWWQHCTLWQRKIENHNGFIKLSEPVQLIVEDKDNPAPVPGRGYLPRCHPIWVEKTKEWYLPLYREEEPYFYGVIMKSTDGETWEHHGNIGKNATRCIQPTIWQKDDHLHALLRNFNFGSRKQRYAYHSTCPLGENTWSEPKESAIFNANNSLVTLNEAFGVSFKHPLFVWNNDPKGRHNISLGFVGQSGVVKIDDYGSYPAICSDWNDLHVLYTTKADPLKTPNCATVIKHKIYNILALKKNLQK